MHRWSSLQVAARVDAKGLLFVLSAYPRLRRGCY